MRVKPDNMSREELLALVKDVSSILDEDECDDYDDDDQNENDLSKFRRIMYLWNCRVDT